MNILTPGSPAKPLIPEILEKGGEGGGTLPGFESQTRYLAFYLADELTSEQWPAARPHRHLLSAAAVGERSA